MYHENNPKYQKAKYDIIQAMKSVQDLTDYQKEQLIQELFGTELLYQFKCLLESYRLGGH